MGKKKLLESRCSPSYIYDMMSTLSKNNSVEKLAEIDLIGFGFLRLVPNWSVKQAIMVHLAESYQVKPRTFILDIGNIRLNAELIGKVFGIPSQGDPFPALDESNPSHVAIKNRFHRRSTTELRDLVYSCPMTTESERMEFRRYFILVVMKMFLCPTTQQVLSPWHIYPVLDVSDPRRFNWPLEILKWFDTAVEKYKLKGNKTCEGCMFVVLILYFQRMQYGVLDNCLEHEPWLEAWTSERLEKKAQYIISEGRLLTRHGVGDDIKGRSPQAARRRPGKKEPQKRQQKQSVLPRRSVGGESKQVSNERPPRGSASSPPPTARSSRRAKLSETSTRPNRGDAPKMGEAKKDRPRRCPPKKSEEKDLPSGTDDDEENEPLAKRMCRLYKQGVDKKKTSDEPTEGNLNQDKGTHETPVSVLPDAGTLSVALVKHEEWDNPNFLSNRDPESERIWQYFEQLQNTSPLQAVMPANPSCMTPSPPGKQISLGNAGTEQQYTQCTPIKVHPLLKGRKIDEDDEEQVRRWAANGSLEQSEVLASYEGRQHLSLLREDLCSLLPRHWVTSNIVQWMCSTFNDSESLRYKEDFYCIPPGILETVLQKRNLASFREDPTVSYVGLGPHFGDDSMFFDKIAASMRKWWFAPVCIDRHWWLYAFEIAHKRLWVLDSMNTGVPNNERVKLHAYAGRLIEDMAKVSMPAYEHTENGLPRFYASVPQQDNGCDCGVFVIKFMQFWCLDKPLQHWDQDIVHEFRKEIILDIVLGPHNSEIGKALQALESNHVRRNQPRKKSKAVRSPFTAPSTKSMLKRAGLPTRKPRKGGRQRK
ncbi:uncharacterized protein DS421_18g612360 [Arachis hypogaea]|nr:uncharacterized protein DS421_18g612360 [Arachis hypogaea]